MEPIFTIPYSEYLSANLLSQYFKAKDGYSIFIPASRQEKGIDILLTKRGNGSLQCASFQVKSSRTYSPLPAKREGTIRFSYSTWFNKFLVPKEADFFLLVGIYPPEENRTRKSTHSWWNSVVLMFTQKEMESFMDQVKTKQGNSDKMFGFGFDDSSKIVLTRGDQNRTMKDYSSYLFESRIGEIQKMFLNQSNT